MPEPDKRWMYPNAGQGAPPGVRHAIQVFRDYPVVMRQHIALIWWLLGPKGTNPYKMTPTEASYVSRAPEARSCGRCQHAYRHMATGVALCNQIQGTIRREASCNLWRRSVNKRDFIAHSKE